MVFVVNEDVDNEDSVYFGGENIEVELSHVLDFEDDVGREIEALDSMLVYFSIGHMDVLFEFSVFQRINRLSRFGRPVPLKAFIILPGQTTTTTIFRHESIINQINII